MTQQGRCSVSAVVCLAWALVLASGTAHQHLDKEPQLCHASAAVQTLPRSVLARLVQNVCGNRESKTRHAVEYVPAFIREEKEKLQHTKPDNMNMWYSRNLISGANQKHNMTDDNPKPETLHQEQLFLQNDTSMFYFSLPRTQEVETDDVPAAPGPGYSDDVGMEWTQARGSRAWIAPVQDIIPNALCRNHSRLYLEALVAGNSWALQMLDASGKLPDGILSGNLNALGSWDACVRVEVSLNRTETQSGAATHFRGRICGAMLLNDPESTNLTRFHLPAAVRYGYCVPSSCDAADIGSSLNALLNGSGVMAVVGQCHADGDVITLTTGDVTLIALLGLVAVLLIFCSAADAAIYYREKLRSPTLHIYQGKTADRSGGASGLLRAFSLQANMKKLLEVRKTSDIIGCVGGIRVLSMAWINLGHTYIIGFLARPNSGQARLPEIIKSWPMQLIMNAFPAVDTFLLIGGTMFSYSLLKATRAGRAVGVRQVLLMYVQRYLRLTPVYAVVVWFSATLLHHCTTAMFANINYSLFGIAGCRRYWWRNMLYINNLYPSDFNTCVDQAWYLGVDFQLFILAPFLVLPYTRWRRLGIAWLVGWSVVSVVIPGVITGMLNLPPTLLNINGHATAPDVQHDFNLYIYNAPWSRASPYLIGLGLGLLLREVASGGVRVCIGRSLNLLLWLLSAAVALLVLFGMHRYNSDPQSLWTPTVAVAYGALHRPAWALSVGWVVLACATGRGGPVQHLLSHPLWVPLSRLTYSTYLCAMQLQVWYASQDRVAVEFSHTGYVCWFLADLLINVALGLLLWLSIEAPAAALQALLLGNKYRRRVPELTPSQMKAIAYSNYSEADGKQSKQLEDVPVNSTDL